jgi:hypothetical protein
MGDLVRNLLAGAGALVFIVALLWLLGWSAGISPWIPAVVVSGIIAVGSVAYLEEKLGRRITAWLLVALAAAVAVSLAIEHASVGVCVLVFWVGSFALYRARSAFEPESAIDRIVHHLFTLQVTVAAVASGIWLISIRISKAPPDSILEWREAVNRAIRYVEIAEKISTALLIVGILLYIAIAISDERRGAKPFSNLWTWITSSRNQIERVSLVLAAVAAFSFIAGDPDGGPLEELNQATAKALEQYRDIVWQVELTLRSEVAFEAAQSLMEGSPAAIQNAVATEEQLNLRNTPSAYFASPSLHLNLDQLLKIGDPVADRRADVETPTQAALGSERHRLTSLPPAHTSLHRLSAVQGEAQKPEHQIAPDAPAWLKGQGADVLENVVELGVSPDRIPVLKAIGDQMPLVGQLIGAVFDSFDEQITDAIKSAAERIVADRIRGKTNSLWESVPEQARIIRALRPESIPTPATWRKWGAIARTESEADAAQAQFNADLRLALRDQEEDIARDNALYAQLDPRHPDQSDLRALLNSAQYASTVADDPKLSRGQKLLNSNEISLDRLKAQQHAFEFAENQIGLYVVDTPPGQREAIEALIPRDIRRHYEEIGVALQTKRMQERSAAQRDIERDAETREFDGVP